MSDPYIIKSPAWIVPGFDALVGRFSGKLKYFSFPFNSLILIVIGNIALNAVTAALLLNVAVKVLLPIFIFSFNCLYLKYYRNCLFDDI